MKLQTLDTFLSEVDKKKSAERGRDIVKRAGGAIKRGAKRLGNKAKTTAKVGGALATALAVHGATAKSNRNK